MTMQRRFMCIITVILCLGMARAQNYSDDVQYISGDENAVTVQATGVDEKKKEAEAMAIKSAFHCLFHSGVAGLKDGQPILSETKPDYDYRFLHDGRYINYIIGQPRTLETKKIGNKQRATVVVSINLRTLKAELTRNRQVFSPAWADAKKKDPTSALNPTIVVVPYTDGNDGYSFEAMRRRIEAHPAERYAVERVAEAFLNHGFKTRDFVTQLQNSKNADVLRAGTQADDATMMVQQLPGDIVVTVGISAQTNGNTTRVSLNTGAVERQTAGRLATKTFASGYYHTTDTTFLVREAIKQIEKDFFNQLQASFEQMINKGREVQLDINLSETVSDWDFDQDSPESGEYFKDALDDWLRDNAFHGIYDMSQSTDKYIRASINVPLWNAARNRSYTLSNFGSDLRKFFKKQLGENYKANVTAMGQSMTIVID